MANTTSPRAQRRAEALARVQEYHAQLRAEEQEKRREWCDLIAHYWVMRDVPAWRAAIRYAIEQAKGL